MPALPGQPCETPPRSEWTKPEKWVWRQVCEGKTANFNDVDGELDPRDPEGWSHRRLISPQFLETILVYDPFRSALPRVGVRIIGAWVTGQIDLEHGHLAHPWSLGKSRFDADVQLSSLQSANALSFEGSVFTGTLGLAGAKVGGVLNMNGAQCSGTLNIA